jgi:neutral ceramidase
MKTIPRLALLIALTASGIHGAVTPDPLAWKAGVAAVDITPEGPIWMAGYANRKKPSEGVSQKLFAKALALEDAWGSRIVFITLDLIGVPRSTRDAVERHAQARHGLRPESLLLNASHTHSGPAPYPRGVSDPAFVDRANGYATVLEEKILRVVGDALGSMAPATLHYTRARAGFAMNRRVRVGNEIRNSPNPDGPVDHDVPVLRVTGADRTMRALLFGYACHNTVTGFYTINGDYAGYAQAYLEEARPGVTAMFLMGAGGDQNPYPRSVSLEQSAQHGRTLANAVEAALMVVNQRAVRGPLRSALGFAELDYADTSRSDLERRASSRNATEKSRAEQLLKELEKGPLPKSYPCPVQVVQFGTDVTLVAIGGETTVDYSLRLKRELAGEGAAVWVAGYSNDSFGYLGSRRVIVEGGYEGYSANLNRHPGPWATTAEERVITMVYELTRSINH